MNYTELSYAEQKKQILNDVNNYVNHSDIVYKKSKFVNNANNEMLREIHTVKNFICEINKYSSLFDICLKIFRLKKRLIKILPHPNNSSYISQYDKLNALIEFSTEYVKPKKQTPNYLTIYQNAKQ